MIANVLRHIAGIEAYGLASIGLFFLFFLGMLVWAMCLKKAFLKSMAALPLEDDDASTDKRETDYE